MAPSNFPSRVRHVQPGDPVTAGVVGGATRPLDARTNFLNAKLDAIEAGHVQIFEDAPVAPDVLNGQPVFWNATTLRFELAKAAVVDDPATSVLAAAASADVLGVILEKQTPNTAHIVLNGLVQLDMSNAIDGTPTPGRYYLSAATPGKLVRQRPEVTVAVCVVLGPMDACGGVNWVYVQPQIRDFLQAHIHFSFELVCLPAGTTMPPSDGGHHVITDADAFVTGWLPADHAIFAGHAPTGAKFGYNLSQHTALQRNWPPVPLTAGVLEMFRPAATTVVGGRVPANQVVFDSYGIWWMTDCYGEAPWPTLTNTENQDISLSSASEQDAEGDCPMPTRMALILSFIKMTFATDRAVVTSLEPDTDEPLAFVNCDGLPATTGDLKARVVLQLLTTPGEALGSQVLKQIAANKFTQGHVVEGLLAGSDRVLLSSATTRLLDPDDEDSATLYQGTVSVDFQTDPTERELAPLLVRLDDALERLYLNIPYIGLTNGKTSGMRYQLNVPPAGLPTSPQMRIRMLIFGMGAGTMTQLSLSYIRIARPTSLVPTPLVAGDTALTAITAVAVTKANAIEVTSEAFDIAAGDTVLFTLSRAASGTPVYDFEMGLIYVRGIVVAAGG